MKQAVNPLEIMEWMEAFLRCYPSNSVRVMIKEFREEIMKNERKHNDHLRRVFKDKQVLQNVWRLRFATFTLYKPRSMSIQPGRSGSQERVCESGPTENQAV